MATKVKNIETLKNPQGNYTVVKGKFLLIDCKGDGLQLRIDNKWLYPIIISETDQQDSLIEGDKVLFTYSDGEHEILTYVEDHGYGMGALNSEGNKVTVRYSSTARILATTEHFSYSQRKSIVDRELNHEDKVFVECEINAMECHDDNCDGNSCKNYRVKLIDNNINLFFNKKESGDWKTTDGSSLRKSFGLPEKSWDDIIQDIAEEYKILIDSRIQDYLEKNYNPPIKK